MARESSGDDEVQFLITEEIEMEEGRTASWPTPPRRRTPLPKLQLCE